MNDATLNRLRFRRQFIFGPRAVRLDGEWQTHRVGADWVLTVQRDLPVLRGQTADGAELLLLGFLIDPEAPELNDQQLLERLCRGQGGWEELLRATVNLSGRWALIHIAGGRVRVVNDATGLRTVYYAVTGQEPWCFSQPGLYRHVQALEYAPEAVEFINSKECQKDFEASWPGASSPYAEVSHLLPNHYLDLMAHRVTRFWPTEPLKPLEVEPAVKLASHLLQHSFQAIARRGPFSLALTAGWDSRTLFAASRAVVKQAWVNTAIYGELHAESHDLRISAALCELAGVPHHVLRCPMVLTEPFQSVFLQNNDPAHFVWGRICQGMLEGYPADMMAVRGNVSETARCFYYKDGKYPEGVTAADLPRLTKMPDSPFVRRHFDGWFADAQSVSALGYKVLDFLYWENRMATWLGASHIEYDVVHDTFSPFSNRRLLATLLATPVQARCKPDWALYRQWIGSMWPELMQFPFNPPDTQGARLSHKFNKARRQVRSLLGLYDGQVRLQARSRPTHP